MGVWLAFVRPGMLLVFWITGGWILSTLAVKATKVLDHLRPSFSHDLVRLLGILRKIESRYKTSRFTIVAPALMQIFFSFVQLYIPSFPDMEFHYCKVLCKLKMHIIHTVISNKCKNDNWNFCKLYSSECIYTIIFKIDRNIRNITYYIKLIFIY